MSISLKAKLRWQKKYDCILTVFLRKGKKVMFNCSKIGKCNDSYFLSQPGQVFKLEKVSERYTDEAKFAVQRAKGTYIAAVGRPSLTSGFAQESQIVNPDDVAVRTLNQNIQKAKECQ